MDERESLERILDGQGSAPITRYLLDGPASADAAFSAAQPQTTA